MATPDKRLVIEGHLEDETTPSGAAVARVVNDRIGTKAADKINEILPGELDNRVPAEVAQALASDTLPAQAAAAAVDQEIAGRSLVESNDERLPDKASGSGYLEAFIDVHNRTALGIKEDGSVDVPLLNSESVEVSGESKLETLFADTYLSGSLDAQNRLAEDALLKSGRKPDWVLQRWSQRMAELTGGTAPNSGTPPMDILLGGGQSNMGSTSDKYPTGAPMPDIHPDIYVWSGSSIVRMKDTSQSNKDNWAYRAIHSFATEYAKNHLQPGRGILVVNAGVGSSGFSTTTIDPAPAGYKNVLNNGAVRQDTGSWEVGFTQDTNNLYVRMIAMANAAKTAAPAGSEFKAFLWSQGESDVNMRTQAAYGTQLDLLISQMRTDLGASTLPALIGSMVPDWVAVSPSDRGTIQAALEDTPRRVERSAYAWGPEGLGDLQSIIHWSAQGQLARGPIFRDAFLRAPLNVAAAEPLPPQNIKARRSGGNVVITWEHPPTRFTAFNLEYRIDAGTWTSATLANPVTTETLLAIGLNPASTIGIRMSTTNPVGTSAASREVLA